MDSLSERGFWLHMGNMSFIIQQELETGGLFRVIGHY